MIYSLQAYRGIAAVMVVLFHASIAAGTYLGDSSLKPYFPFGAAGVQFFFVLSGFIIYWIHARDIDQPSRLPTYLKKRLVRIYPIYWVVMLAVLVLSLSIGAEIRGTTRDVLLSISLLPQPLEPTPVGAAWTLVHEITFYLLFATLLLSRRFGTAIMWLWAIGICVTLVMYPLHTRSRRVIPEKNTAQNVLPAETTFREVVEQPEHQTAANAGEETSAAEARHGLPFPASFYFNVNNLLFLMGIVSAMAQRKYSALQGRLGLASFLAGNMLFITVSVCHVALEWGKDWPLLILAYGVASFFIVLGATSEQVQGLFQNRKWLLFLGDASYSIYLIHFAALRLPAKAFQITHVANYVPTWILFLVMSAFGVVVGCLLYAYVEKPLLEYLNARLIKRTEKKPSPLTVPAK